jgi:hypothetical protein
LTKTVNLRILGWLHCLAPPSTYCSWIHRCRDPHFRSCKSLPGAPRLCWELSPLLSQLEMWPVPIKMRPQPFVTGNVANPKQQAPLPPFATRNGCAPQQNAHPLPSGAATPMPGGHTPFSGIPPPPQASTPASLAAAGIPDSQQSCTYTQPGAKHTVHLDYVLYSQ